jgi:hypothetical protein
VVGINNQFLPSDLFKFNIFDELILKIKGSIALRDNTGIQLMMATLFNKTHQNKLIILVELMCA